jgi:glycosyltransferase involved in cell wall biosynthesis
MTVVHISGDFPDDIVPGKTRAIANLLELTRSRFDHFVYSLNRRSPGAGQLGAALLRRPFSPQLNVEEVASGVGKASLSYAGPARGLFLKTTLGNVADWIASDVERRGISTTLVQGHKLTIEGIVAAQVAQRLKVPYALSIQGNTDAKILSARPDLLRLYSRIYHGAEVVFPFTPWALDYLTNKLGERKGATILLPCATAQDRLLKPKLVGPLVRTAFHLKEYRLKNAARLVRASASLERVVPGYRLEIIGGGSAEGERQIRRSIAKAGAGSVSLNGPIPHEQIQQEMNSAGVFALVSHRESFGMVFVEALLAGCPIVYPAGRAVDGYFDDLPFAIAAPPNDQEAITQAIHSALRDEVRLKRALAEWQERGGARFFQRECIRQRYSAGLSAAIAGPR